MKMKRMRKTENVSNDESKKLKCNTRKAKKHQIIKVMENKITSKIPETTPIMMTCKKDQRTGRLIRRVDRGRMNS